MHLIHYVSIMYACHYANVVLTHSLHSTVYSMLTATKLVQNRELHF